MEDYSRLLQELARAVSSGKSVALVTVTGTRRSAPREVGAKMIVYDDGKISGTIGGGVLEAAVIKEAVKALKEAEPAKVEYTIDPEKPGSLTMCCGGEMELFIDVFCPASPLIIFGAGHVGEKIAELAEMVGIPYIIVDDRREYAEASRFPRAARVYSVSYAKAFRDIPIEAGSYIVICTHAHAHDLLCLSEALKTKAAYIGVIASKNKAARFRQQLEKEGIKADDNRLYSPIGLDLGDSSPAQIALSVMSEIVKIRSGGSGTHKRLGGLRR